MDFKTFFNFLNNVTSKKEHEANIVNSIRISINIYMTAHDISNSSLKQKEIKQFLKQCREQQSEPKNEDTTRYSF